MSINEFTPIIIYSTMQCHSIQVMLINCWLSFLELGIVNITSVDPIYDGDLQLSRIIVTWGLSVSITNKYLVSD